MYMTLCLYIACIHSLKYCGVHVCVFSHALGIGMQALMLVEQALYQLSHALSLGHVYKLREIPRGYATQPRDLAALPSECRSLLCRHQALGHFHGVSAIGTQAKSCDEERTQVEF